MPDGRVSRLLNRAELRRYLGGVPWAEVDARMVAGRLPRPVWGLDPDDRAARWDVRAVDRALDHASGVPSTIEAGTAALDRALGLA